MTDVQFSSSGDSFVSVSSDIKVGEIDAPTKLQTVYVGANDRQSWLLIALVLVSPDRQ